MSNYVSDWSRFLRTLAGPEGVPHQVTIEVAEVVAASPLTIRHRGFDSSAGVDVAAHVATPVPNGPCLVAVLSGQSNLTTGLRVVIATI